MIVYFAFIFLFDFTSCHTICLLVLVNSDAHFGSGVIINLEILKTTTIKKKIILTLGSRASTKNNGAKRLYN